jgi:hypothetical protein
MVLPFLILLLMGTLELGRITYTYYTLHKILYAMAGYVASQQGVNFCDSTDATVAAAASFALTGTTDNSGAPILADLTADMLNVRIEQADPSSGSITQCPCGVPGCDTANGGTPPDFVVVSIPGGYPVTPHIPLIPLNAIPLTPQVRVPYGGT